VIHTPAAYEQVIDADIRRNRTDNKNEERETKSNIKIAFVSTLHELVFIGIENHQPGDQERYYDQYQFIEDPVPS
jgi:hypothetical protein